MTQHCTSAANVTTDATGPPKSSSRADESLIFMFCKNAREQKYVKNMPTHIHEIELSPAREFDFGGCVASITIAAAVQRFVICVL